MKYLRPKVQIGVVTVALICTVVMDAQEQENILKVEIIGVRGEKLDEIAIWPDPGSRIRVSGTDGVSLMQMEPGFKSGSVTFTLENDVSKPPSLLTEWIFYQYDEFPLRIQRDVEGLQTAPLVLATDFLRGSLFAAIGQVPFNIAERIDSWFSVSSCGPNVNGGCQKGQQVFLSSRFVMAFAAAPPQGQAQRNEAIEAYGRGRDHLENLRFTVAIQDFRRAFEIVAMPEIHLALGVAYSGVPDLDAAQREFEEGLQLSGSRADSDRLISARLNHQLGRIWLMRGGPTGLDQAERYTRDSLEINQTLGDEGEADLAANYVQLAQIERSRSRANFRQALDYARRAYALDSRAGRRAAVARDAEMMAQIHHDQGDLDQALEFTRQSQKMDAEVHGAGSTTLAWSHDNLAAILAERRNRGDLKRALENANKALALWEQQFHPNHPSVARGASTLATVFFLRNKKRQALPYAQRALQIDERAFGPDHLLVAGDSNLVGAILQAQKDLEAALPYLQRAVQIAQTNDHPYLSTLRNNIEVVQEKIRKRRK